MGNPVDIHHDDSQGKHNIKQCHYRDDNLAELGYSLNASANNEERHHR